jgi:hypothetical protein
MKKTFDELCQAILGENNSDTNPVSTNPNTPATSVIPGGSTSKQQTNTQTTPTSQQNSQNQQTAQQSSTMKPDEVLITLGKLKSHPEFIKVIGDALEQLSKNQQQKNFINQQTNASQQTQPTA